MHDPTARLTKEEAEAVNAMILYGISYRKEHLRSALRTLIEPYRVPDPLEAVSFSPGVQIIACERARQMEREGWTADHDDQQHADGELVEAAVCYAQAHLYKPGQRPMRWPWDMKWWKPRSAIENLRRAGALIAAEIDRLMRAEGIDTSPRLRGTTTGRFPSSRPPLQPLPPPCGADDATGFPR